MVIPQFLENIKQEHPEHKPWVDALPSLFQKITEEWKLENVGHYFKHSTCSYVVPCVTQNHMPAILKLGLPHPEALHEADALKILSGDPTVQLLKYDEATGAMLLEKCSPGTHLRTKPEPFQDEIICQMLKKVWDGSYLDGPFRPLSQMVELWNSESYANLDTFPDQELAKKGCKMKEYLISTTTKYTLLATDLHAGNVLRAQRKPWLAIDLKPYFGDPCYDLTQHLINCMDRFSRDPISLINRVANLAEVDAERVKLWMFSRLSCEKQGVHQEIASKLI